VLALTFQIGPNRLALPVREITEVVPRVDLTPAPFGPAWLAGVFVRRGRVVPVVDLHRLFSAGPCPAHLSSRIILVALPGDPGGRTVGLLAARVADVRDMPPPKPAAAAAGDADRAALGSAMVDAEGIIHFAAVARLLPAACRQPLADLCQPADS
jgi:chemotaxis-related protein WspB